MLEGYWSRCFMVLSGFIVSGSFMSSGMGMHGIMVGKAGRNRDA